MPELLLLMTNSKCLNVEVGCGTQQFVRMQFLDVSHSLLALFGDTDAHTMQVDFAACESASHLLWQCICKAAPELASRLRVLHAKGALMVQADKVQPCVSAMAQLTELRQLDLSDSWFSQGCAALLAPAVSQLAQLERLALGNHKEIGRAGDTFADALVSSIVQLRKLRELRAIGNAISLQAFMQLLQSGSQLHNLHRMDVNSNRFADLDAKALVAALPALSALTRLDMGYCSIASDKLRAIRNGLHEATGRYVVSAKGLFTFEGAVV